VPWLKPGQRKYSEKDLPADSYKRSLYEEGKKLFQFNYEPDIQNIKES
jgi:oxygen-independent coproporphyrinogen-3 oxidase